MFSIIKQKRQYCAVQELNKKVKPSDYYGLYVFIGFSTTLVGFLCIEYYLSEYNDCKNQVKNLKSYLNAKDRNIDELNAKISHLKIQNELKDKQQAKKVDNIKKIITSLE
jgi:hypothetical protein